MSTRSYWLRRKALLEESFPVVVPLGTFAAITAMALGAAAQRRSLFPPGVALLWSTLTFVPMGLLLVFATGVRWWRMNTVAFLAGTVLLFSVPVQTPVLPFIPASADATGVLLPLLVGVVAALTGALESTVTMACGVAVVGIAAVDGWLPSATLTPLYFCAVPFGWLCGLALQSQRRLLERTREARERARERAVEAERGRIAREIHDVVAHSLAVTMLHLTGARRALQTDDVDEAVAALTDAEHVGRQAMTDIRRTVGLLTVADDVAADRPAEPGLSDVDDLVAGYRRAGLDVRYQVNGDVDAVSAGTGLALYRVIQESLANVVRHAATAAATVELAVNPDGAIELTVSNEECPGMAVARGRGRGIDGMRQRVVALGGTMSAGPSDTGGWTVRVSLPSADMDVAADRRSA